MKTTLKGRFEANKTSAAGVISVNAGDVKLKASMTDATIAKGPSLSGLVLSLENPGSYVIDYNVSNKDFRFKVMNSVRVLERQVNLMYVHTTGDGRTAVDGTVVFDKANKVSANYVFGTGNCRVKYVYTHGEMQWTVMEPSYDFSKNVWDFAVSRKFDGGDSLKATYQTESKALGLEWNRDSKVYGGFKISALFNLAEQNIIPKLVAESTWNFEI